MNILDVHRAIANLDADVVVQTIEPANVVNRGGIGAVFVVRGQIRRVDGGALHAWMTEDLAGGATLSQRLLATLRGGFG